MCGERSWEVVVIAVYMTKQSRGVLGMTRCDTRTLMQRSRASGTANLLRDGRFCGPLGVPDGSPEVPARSRGVPRWPHGRPRDPRVRCHRVIRNVFP